MRRVEVRAVERVRHSFTFVKRPMVRFRRGVAIRWGSLRYDGLWGQLEASFIHGSGSNVCSSRSPFGSMSLSAPASLRKAKANGSRGSRSGAAALRFFFVFPSVRHCMRRNTRWHRSAAWPSLQ